MSKRKAARVDLLGEVPSDIPGKFWRFERRHWADGSSCLHISAWGTQPNTGRLAPWYPLEYTQVPWEMAADWGQALVQAVRVANVHDGLLSIIDGMAAQGVRR